MMASTDIGQRRAQPKSLKATQFKRFYATPPSPSPAPAAGSPNAAYPAGATGSGGGGGNTPMYIILAALVGLGGAGYWYLKPVRDVAAMAHSAATVVKDKAGDVVCPSACLPMV
jgi:hypothetical protein